MSITYEINCTLRSLDEAKLSVQKPDVEPVETTGTLTL